MSPKDRVAVPPGGTFAGCAFAVALVAVAATIAPGARDVASSMAVVAVLAAIVGIPVLSADPSQVWQ